MVAKALELLKRLRKIHGEYYSEVLTIRETIKRGQLMKEELADVALIAREMMALADDTRKECSYTREMAERSACMLWVTEHTANPGNAEPIRGKYAIGSPKVGQMATLPRPDSNPEAYAALLDSLGIPPGVRHLVRPHWPDMVDYFTLLAGEGVAHRFAMAHRRGQCSCGYEHRAAIVLNARKE